MKTEKQKIDSNSCIDLMQENEYTVPVIISEVAASTSYSTSISAAKGCEHCNAELSNVTKLIGQCNNAKCSKPWRCLVEGCKVQFTFKSNIQHHISRHFAKADLDKCFHCDAAKDRAKHGHSLYQKCPNCGILWCLIENCKYEYEKLANISKHRVKSHRCDTGNQARGEGSKELKSGSKKSNVTKVPAYCSCGQLKEYELGKIKGKCSNDQCKKLWCLVKDCYKEYAFAANLNKHLQSHFGNADPNKCLHCDAAKNRAEYGHSLYKKCPNCGILWCLIENCKYECEKVTSLPKHRDHVHQCETGNKPQGEYSKDSISGSNKSNNVTKVSRYCSCGQLKEYKLGKIKGQCSNDQCKRKWCLVLNCYQEYAGIGNIIQHLRDHFTGADPNKCFHCKSDKNRQLYDHQKMARCANCQVYWCLIDNCKMEYDELYSLQIHQGRTHKKAK